MKKFIQFLTLVGELFSIYVLCNVLTTLVMTAIIGCGVAASAIAWLFMIVVAVFVILPCVRIAFIYIRKFFDVSFQNDFKSTTVGV